MSVSVACAVPLCLLRAQGCPFSVAAPNVERFCRLAASHLRAKVHLIRHAPRSHASPLREFHDDLLEIVRRLHLACPSAPFGVLDSTTGSVTPMLWELPPRLGTRAHQPRIERPLL